MHDTLARVVEQEAVKLLKLSTENKEPLSGAIMESLEVLARCAKALKLPPKDDPESPEGSEETEELLGKVDS